MKLAVYGLGKLGYPLFNVLTHAGFDVTGIDPGPWTGILSKEPGLQSERDEKFSNTPVPADVSFIVVPTPSLNKGDHCGGFDSAYVETALRHIRRVNYAGPDGAVNFSSGKGKPVAVIVSTLSPGTCEKLAKRFSTLDIVYNPTFIALGNAVKGLTDPDLLLIGGNLDISPDNVGGLIEVCRIWKQVFEHFNSSTLDTMTAHCASYTEIELIKLSVNAALGTKISLANSLGHLFSAWGVNPKAVEIVGKDPRIGTAYFKPGGPISGPCLPRDNIALQFAGSQKGVHLPLAQATDRVNYMLLDRLYNEVMAQRPKTVGIFGMSYKYGSDVTDSAPGPWLQKALLTREGITCCTYDDVLGGDIVDDIANADVVVVMQEEYALDDEGTSVINLWA